MDQKLVRIYFNEDSEAELALTSFDLYLVFCKYVLIFVYLSFLFVFGNFFGIKYFIFDKLNIYYSIY